MFFVANGLRLDLSDLVENPVAAARVPLFLLALLVVRGVPAALSVPALGRRSAVAAALLRRGEQSTARPVERPVQQPGGTV